MTQATLTFANRNHAEQFATCWVFYSKTGYTMSAGKENVQVSVYDLNEDKKAWIDAYVENMNNQVSP